MLTAGNRRLETATATANSTRDTGNSKWRGGGGRSKANANCKTSAGCGRELAGDRTPDLCRGKSEAGGRGDIGEPGLNGSLGFLVKGSPSIYLLFAGTSGYVLFLAGNRSFNTFPF